jgi:hypothetical protein
MIDGFYSIAFTGVAGSGFGILVFRRGAVVGADAAGATYDWTFRTNEDGTIGVEVVMKAPAGLRPVQTGVPLANPVEMAISGSLPGTSELLDATTSAPRQITTPLGPINIVFRKIRDLVD